MTYKLQDLIDLEHFQNLQDRLNKIYAFPSSIIDNDGNILTATAWQDVCTQFHRKNKASEALCIQSDQYIKEHIHEANPAVTYHCPHGLVDNATPIIIDGTHYGNFFTGQFFQKEPDMVFFRNQAHTYGFDEAAYLEAVKKVPVWTEDQLNNYLFFIKGLIAVISESGLKTLEELENRRRIKASEERHISILKSAMDGYWLTDTEGRLIEVNDAYCRMSGYSEAELLTMQISDLSTVGNSQLISQRMQRIMRTGSDRFESRHRRKDGTLFEVEVSVQFRSEEGGQCVCFLRDITDRKQTEHSLRVSEKKYRTLFENMTQGVFYQRADGVLIECNNAALEMLGLAADQFLGKTSLDPQWKIIDEDGTDLPGEKHPSMIALQTGKPVRDAVIGVYNPRKKFFTWLIINAIPQFKESEKKPYQVFGTIQNITDRRQAERQYQMLFQEMIDGFALHEIICDASGKPVDYRFLAVNPAFEKMTGLAADRILGRTVLDILPATEPYWIETYGRVALSGTPAFFENYSAGVGKHFQVTAFRPAPDQFACIFIDITERKRAEEEIIQQKILFETMFNTIPDGVVITNTRREIRLANRGMASTFGYTPEDLLGKTTEVLYADSQRYRHAGDTVFGKEAKSAGDLYVTRYKDKDGRTFPGETFGAKLLDEKGQWIGNLGIMRDITEREQAELRIQQAQKMESIGNLAGGIAHDFNNILFPILGMSELLLEDLPPDSQQYENVRQIINAGVRGSDLVRQILAFSRQSEHKTLPVRIQKILREVIALTRATIPSYVEIDYDIQQDCGLVMADPTQIHQVAMNVITNAYHAVESSGGKITVTLREAVLTGDEIPDTPLQTGRYAILSVADNGHGIPSDLMAKIFEPYFTTKEQGKGTGLGLAVAYGIIKAHRGEIKVDSRLGKGTTFNIYLPLMEKGTEPVEQSIPQQQPGGSERILLVDDEDAVAELGKQMLERLGYTVTTRVNSIEALNMFKAEPDAFDLVISDMTMPNMTGDQMARELIAIRPDIPIIICTGFSERIDSERAAAMGIKGFLLKPVVKATLAKTVRNVLDGAVDGPGNASGH